MTKIAVFQAEGGDVFGSFDVVFDDYVMLLPSPKAGPSGPVHMVRIADGVDSCNLLGSPCPMDLFTAYSVPVNEYATGQYSVKVETAERRKGPPEISNGNLNVGSTVPGEEEGAHGHGHGHGRGPRRR